MKSEDLYPLASPELSQKRNSLNPEIADAFRNFSKTVFKAGALDEKTKQLIAVAVAHTPEIERRTWELDPIFRAEGYRS